MSSVGLIWVLTDSLCVLPAGKPKGVVHCTGGYMIGAHTTTKYVFNLSPGDVYWCTADCGWITGHTYLTYGPLLVGATQVVFEGVPTYPGPDRCWKIVDKYAVKQFYTAPTAIRSLMRAGDLYVKEHLRDSLRILGSVGEPINPEVCVLTHSACASVQFVMDAYLRTPDSRDMELALWMSAQKPKSMPCVTACYRPGGGTTML